MTQRSVTLGLGGFLDYCFLYPMGYSAHMANYTVKQTEAFKAWLENLLDVRGRIAIARRLERMSIGNFGDSHSVGEGVSELRVDFGPGYRVYYTLRGNDLVIVLAGGDKSTQPRDVKRAQKIAKEY